MSKEAVIYLPKLTVSRDPAASVHSDFVKKLSKVFGEVIVSEVQSVSLDSRGREFYQPFLAYTVACNEKFKLMTETIDLLAAMAGKQLRASHINYVDFEGNRQIIDDFSERELEENGSSEESDD